MPTPALFRLDEHRPGLLLLAVGLAALVIGVALCAAQLFDLVAPAAVTYESPIRVLNNPVTAGDVLELEVVRDAWNITGTGDVPAEVWRQFVRTNEHGAQLQPPQIWILDKVSVPVPNGHSDVVSHLSIIPAQLPPGYWRLEGHAEARHKSSPYYSEPIDVRSP